MTKPTTKLYSWRVFREHLHSLASFVPHRPPNHIFLEMEVYVRDSEKTKPQVLRSLLTHLTLKTHCMHFNLKALTSWTQFWIQGIEYHSSQFSIYCWRRVLTPPNPTLPKMSGVMSECTALLNWSSEYRRDLDWLQLIHCAYLHSSLNISDNGIWKSIA